ncbi:MAG: hypothetical protein HFG33_02695 [Bacilli bacterium]|nr:hypothetical protein [Bacilli bacterium]
MEEKIQKINVPYLIGYILIPIAICALSFMIGYKFFPKGNGAVITFMVPPILSFIWWAFGGSFLFKRNSKNFEKTLDETGFKRAHTFYGRGKTVFIDTENGKIGLVFFWNPTKTYTVPASKVESAWVDDGKGGVGFMEGSSRVSFLFTIDGIKIRVDTFTSNQRFRMDSDYILTGISKAEVMVKMIEEAKKKSTK